ncbi:hypothetical protein ASE80_27135 [Pseudomonas sp. Leaf15]|uniref:dermonecrotic toxin domain-containing protein n=1 Tax=unclassified Pseudomonas TaxID=196821 RepID=UPI000702B56E|nr:MULTISPECIES: DUF6543 domain-containing protein [unclassified Pseudomonas]KQM52058.1 hypothetical protein ASE80_27135 [Pseudomonas sp. Leaf15]RAH01484.1 hypothetical protein DJ480_17890 [Pseudomonas sp. Leaf98]
MPVPIPTPNLSQLPAQAVQAHFATRPALYSVVFNALRSGILEHYPTLKLDLLSVKLATPRPDGVYTYRSLMEVAIAHVLNPQALDLHSKRELPYYLTQQVPKTLKPDPPDLIDMQVIARIIDALPESVALHFQHDLAEYWSAADSHGNSRWQWLGELLNGQMSAAATGQSHLSQAQRDMLRVVATWPTQHERLPHAAAPTYVYLIENTLTHNGSDARLLTPDLLLVRDKHVLLYSVAGEIHTYDDIDAFGEAWTARLQARYQFDSLTWRRNEPEGNVFEHQAGLILNQQLQDLATLSFQGQDEKNLGRRLANITDPALFFSPVSTPAAAVLQKVSDQLPEWLAHATAADRFAYHRHVQDMAHVLQQNQGHAFNEGIENIHSFSRAALRQQMQADHADCDPDQVVLDFSVPAGYPGGAGIIGHVRMTLTELALKNLAGKPKGSLRLSSKNATPLPAWLDEAYLLGTNGLIQRVDIGTTYPQKIKDTLLSDTADARRRETLFTRELKVKLPTQALEYKIRGQHGVTVTGYRYVKALMGEMPSDRIVDEQEIVLRPLALCRTPGAAPDEVSNAFIIEPRDAGVGPHLLYQPLYADALHEYPTRQALLDALATPGALQDSVLTWLSDKDRAIYEHGGIKEPHLIRFVPGDEFRPRLETPVPATLAVDEGAGEWLQSQINGQLLNHLFGSTARALVDLADQASVSNLESRWATVLEGAGLLFNTLLLPVLRGPAMLAGWFMVLVSSLEQDTAGLDSTDPLTREAALIDLLLNTAMVLLHAASPARQALPEGATQDHALHLQAWRRPAGLAPAQATPVMRHGPVALPGEPPASGHTALDFSHSIASPKAGARLLKALLEVHVPWPEPLPQAQPSGALKGLYRIDGTWHASVGGLLFQVSIVPGFSEVYLVHPQRPEHPGFKLISDGQGHWRLDRGARLEGGMPRQRLAELAERKKQRLKELPPQLQIHTLEMLPLAAQTQQFYGAVEIARVQVTQNKLALREDWERLNNPELLPALRPRIAERHAQRQLATAQARTQWGIAVDNYRQNTQGFITGLQKTEAMAVELMALDRTEGEYRKARDNALENIFKHWLVLYANQHQKIQFTLESLRGETFTELLNRIDTELPDNITDGYDEFVNAATQRLEALNEVQEYAQHCETILQQAAPALRESLLRQIPANKTVSLMATKQSILLSLAELLLNRSIDADIPQQRPYLELLADRQIYSTVNSHIEISTTTGYSPREQIHVLKDALEQYGRMENAVHSLTEMRCALLREQYREPFLAQLGEARASLEAQLANLILVEEKIAPRPATDKAKRQKPANRKVIRTADKKSLVGDLRAGTTDEPGQYVDITDTLTGAIVATYHEHAGEGVWSIVEPAAPAIKAPTPAARSLKTIRAHAAAIKAERAGIDASIRYQQRKLLEPSQREDVDPHDWDVMLSQHAAKFEGLANELKGAVEANAIDMRNRYHDEAKAATQRAREACAEGYLLQRPRAAKVDYLWTHGFVDINLVKKRVPLKAGDYLTEYAIREKSQIKPGIRREDADLWYAHFHYPDVETPASAPAFGHLKTKAERRYTRKELIEQARANNRAVVNLDKALIEAPLDQKLFLGLEGDESAGA